MKHNYAYVEKRSEIDLERNIFPGLLIQVYIYIYTAEPPYSSFSKPPSLSPQITVHIPQYASACTASSSAEEAQIQVEANENTEAEAETKRQIPTDPAW